MEAYMRRLCFLLCLPALLLLGLASANAQTDMNRNVIAAGAVDAANAAFHVAGTLGQPLIGSISTLHRTTSQGFWYANPQATSSTPVPGVMTALIDCMPNPIAGSATLNITVPESGNVMITLHDLLGRTVQELADGSRKAGSFSVEMNTEGLPEGRYTIRYRYDEGEKFLPVLIVK